MCFVATSSQTTNYRNRVVAPPVPKMLLTWLLLGSTLASAQVVPANVTFSWLSANGTGCKYAQKVGGTTWAGMTANGDRISFIFTTMIARPGVNSSTVPRDLNCEHTIAISSPGFTFAVANTTFEGQYRLSNKTEVEARSTWRAADEDWSVSVRSGGFTDVAVSLSFSANGKDIDSHEH